MATDAVDEWADVMMDALRASDDGNNPFYSDDPDTISLARQLAEAVVAHLAESPPSDRLAPALHRRYAGALCISELGLHTYDECDAKEQWLDDAAALGEAVERFRAALGLSA
jgi:hypothetical protein